MAAGQVLPGKKRLRVKIEIDLKSCRPKMLCIYWREKLQVIFKFRTGGPEAAV